MGARKMPNAGRDVGVGGRARSLREGIRQQHVRLVRILGRGIQRCHVRARSVFDAMRAARRSECDTNSRSLRDSPRDVDWFGPRLFVGDLPLWARARQYRPARAGSPHSATMAAWEMTKEALRKVCRDNNG